MIKNDNFKKDLVDFCIDAFVILLYFVSQYFTDLPFKLFGYSINDLSYTLKTIYLILYELTLAFIIILIYFKRLKIQFKDFMKNKDIYFKKYFKYWIYMMIGMMLSNLILSYINDGAIANNEQGIRDILVKNPIYVYVAGVILAPIVEELVFRFSFRNIFKTDLLFIIVSGLVFGGAHVIGQANTLVEYLYIIPYSIPGFVFAYLFVKTNNIFTSMSMHLFHNGLLIALQIFVALFG